MAPHASACASSSASPDTAVARRRRGSVITNVVIRRPCRTASMSPLRSQRTYTPAAPVPASANTLRRRTSSCRSSQRARSPYQVNRSQSMNRLITPPFRPAGRRGRTLAARVPCVNDD
jgi:hypothetical protein